MIGVTRGISTLAGAAVAGVLLWIATQIGTESNGEYWATYGVIAAAGLTMALSQLLGGWTKWGWPRFSLGVFLVGFLPVLVAGGWVLLARQPADWMNTSNWSRDLGIYGAVADVGNILPAVAFGIGLVFGFSFDTAGPRPRAGRGADAGAGGRCHARRARRGRAVDRRAPAVCLRRQRRTEQTVDDDGATGRPRRRLARLAGAILALQAHEQEDRSGGDERQDQRRRRRRPRAESCRARAGRRRNRPEKRLLPLVDRRHAQMHRRRS